MQQVKTRHYKIWCENNVLFAVILGQWSEIEVKTYAQDFKKVAYLLSHEPWAHISYLEEWELSTPESAKYVQEIEQWCNQNNLQCNALVYAPNAIKDYVVGLSLQKAKDYPDSFRHFNHSEDAIRWIAEKGYHPISKKIVV